MIWSRATPRKVARPPHQGAAQVDKLFDEIVRSDAVLGILKKLLGPGLRLHDRNST